MTYNMLIEYSTADRPSDRWLRKLGIRSFGDRPPDGKRHRLEFTNHDYWSPGHSAEPIELEAASEQDAHERGLLPFGPHARVLNSRSRNAAT